MKRIVVAIAVSVVLAACGSDTDGPTTAPQTTTEGSAGPGEETTEPASEEPTTEDTTAPSDDPTTESTDEPTSDPTDTGEDSGDFTTGPSQSADFPDLVGAYLPETARVGGHDTYERVVVEYSGNEGTLNWSASYEDAPIQDGSGFEVDMGGEEFLTVWVSGVTYPTGDPGEFEISGLNQATAIQDVHVDMPFEGMHTFFIGVDEKRPYRVQVLNDPMRIVVDVQK